jgi:hypothetical protein
LERELTHTCIMVLHVDNKEQFEDLKIEFINKAEKLIAEAKDLQIEKLSEVGYKYSIANTRNEMVISYYHLLEFMLTIDAKP